MKKTLLTKFEKLMAAAAFAEEGERATALEFLQEEINTDSSAVPGVDLRNTQAAQATH
jgi:hypothetical protein